MRLTDSRYSNERLQFELAIRMIGHEARTRTIRECTGLSDDRIRKVFNSYFKGSGVSAVRRRRGKSPRQITLFVKSPGQWRAAPLSEEECRAFREALARTGLCCAAAHDAYLINLASPDGTLWHRSLERPKPHHESRGDADAATDPSDAPVPEE